MAPAEPIAAPPAAQSPPWPAAPSAAPAPAAEARGRAPWVPVPPVGRVRNPPASWLPSSATPFAGGRSPAPTAPAPATPSGGDRRPLLPQPVAAPSVSVPHPHHLLLLDTVEPSGLGIQDLARAILKSVGDSHPRTPSPNGKEPFEAPPLPQGLVLPPPLPLGASQQSEQHRLSSTPPAGTLPAPAPWELAIMNAIRRLQADGQ
eukprot:EG_transcript_11268